MSSQIRKDLGRTLGHARRHHRDYVAFKTNYPAPWNDLQKAQASTLLTRMKDDIKSFDRYFGKWLALNERIQDDDEFEAESTLYNEWMDNPDYDEMMCDLKDFCAEIESHLVLVVSSPIVDRTPSVVEVVESQSDISLASTQPYEVHATMDMAASHVAEEVTVGATVSQLANVRTVGATVPSPTPHGFNVFGTLPVTWNPALNIPKFSGDTIKWKAFWQRFDLNVHSQAYSKIQKMDTLLGLLDGRALEEVEGFEISAENYDSVVQLLRERFGNNDIIVNQLQAKLRGIEVASQSAESLRTTVNLINNMCRQLKNFGVDIENASLRLDIIDKMPPREKGELKWLLVSSPGTSTESLLKKMTEFALKAEVLEQDRKGGISKPTSTSTAPTTSKAPTTNDSTNNKVICCLCDGDHWFTKCSKYVTPDEKLKQLKLRKLCTKCSRNDHVAEKCTKYVKCGKCHERHYTVLCNQKRDVPSKSLIVIERKQSSLLTKQVTVFNPDANISKEVVIFFDCGSNRSYISDALAKDLKLAKVNIETLNVEGFGAKVLSYKSSLVKLRVKTIDDFYDIYANSTKKIASAVPVFLSENFELAELATTYKKPDVLIGMDYFFEFITSFEKHGEYYVVNSKVGKMLSGKIVQPPQNTFSSLAIESSLCSTEVEDDVQRLWKLEAVGITEGPSETNIEDKVALEKFEQAVKFKDNRYFVSWPVKPDHKPLPTNAGLAIGRLKSCLKKLSQNPELMKAYDGIIKDQLERGTIEVAPKVPQGKLVHYLPHHAVITPDKATTKVRMVFDASAKLSKDTPSLNECLYRGPIKVPDLCGILFRIRSKPVMITGDVEKAFHQIYLNDEDRDAVRFFWLKDINKPLTDENLIIYRFAGTTFGVISSPYTLSYCIGLHFSKLGDEIAKEAEENTYIDNMFFLVDTPEEGIEQYRTIRAHFLQASMNIREWLSNNSEVNKAIPKDLQQKSTTTKVLGIVWDSCADTLQMELKNETNVDTWTKRNVLKFIASSFDPLGFISPVTIKGRIFMQKLFKQSLHWDEILPVEMLKEWYSILMDWKGIIQIPRKFVNDKLPNPDKIEIHCFADASQDAYCACIYLRIPTTTGFETPLVFAKTRLQPLSKNLTIPKMEIMGIWLAAKIGTFVAKQLKLESSQKIIWTDSQISYWWFQKWPKDVFVSNRLKEVVASNVECLFIPGKLNPADLGTRGISFDELLKAHFWLHGPNFLQQPREKWPKSPDGTQTITALIAIVEADTTSNFVNVEVRREFEIDKRLTWAHLKRDVALKQKQASADGDMNLSIDDLAAAERALIIQEQRMFLTPKLETDLKLSKDEFGILRINCRFDHAELINAHPIYLPKNSPLAQIVILDIHEKLHHAGVPHTLAKVREQFWIPCGRHTVKKILQRCGNCKVWKGKPFALPHMPDLPASRVNKTKPFQNTGVDYCGPFKVKGDNEKVWVILFTCFTTRLMHLEPVTNMTTEAFLHSFRRFVARRGVPHYVLSDNAKQFKTVSTALQDIWKNAICDPQSLDYFNESEIVWDFITERAPWKGGLYERLVALVKNALKQSIGRKFINFNEFWTFLTEVESTLNSRPLTYVHAEEPFVIRPNDFIAPAIQTNLPSFSPDDDPNDPTFLLSTAGGGERLAERYFKTLQHLDKFWSLWNENYLNLLRERNNNQHKNKRGALERKPEIDEIVLVYEPDQPRGLWKSAKIINVIKSSDGEIRSAEIKYTKDGFVTRRSINHLYPIEETSVLSEPHAISTVLDS